MAMDEKELGNLIGSDKVEGTAVYGSDERKIGSIERVMIDKKSGRVSYAVLGFGAFSASATTLSAALAIAQIRHEAWWLCHRRDREPAARRAEIRQRTGLELGRHRHHPGCERLLRCAARLSDDGLQGWLFVRLVARLACCKAFETPTAAMPDSN